MPRVGFELHDPGVRAGEDSSWNGQRGRCNRPFVLSVAKLAEFPIQQRGIGFDKGRNLKITELWIPQTAAWRSYP
jgi:hypothetical protein